MNKVEKMDKNVQQLTSSNTAMEATLQTLHEGQLSMDNIIKMLMLKLGIQTGSPPTNIPNNKENTRAATATEANELKTWTHVDDDTTHGGDTTMDGAEEFNELTDEIFDDVLQQCERDNVHTISPPQM